MTNIAETYMRRIWDEKDLGAIDDLVSPAAMIHSSLGDFTGIEPLKKVAETWLNAFPDLVVKNVLQICEDDLVAIGWEATGTHLGIFKQIEPTSRTVSYSGMTVYRIKNDKIVEYWAYLDLSQILQQIT